MGSRNIVIYPSENFYPLSFLATHVKHSYFLFSFIYYSLGGKNGTCALTISVQRSNQVSKERQSVGQSSDISCSNPVSSIIYPEWEHASKKRSQTWRQLKSYKTSILVLCAVLWLITRQLLWKNNKIEYFDVVFFDLFIRKDESAR